MAIIDIARTKEYAEGFAAAGLRDIAQSGRIDMYPLVRVVTASKPASPDER